MRLTTIFESPESDLTAAAKAQKAYMLFLARAKQGFTLAPRSRDNGNAFGVSASDCGITEELGIPDFYILIRARKEGTGGYVSTYVPPLPNGIRQALFLCIGEKTFINRVLKNAPLTAAGARMALNEPKFRRTFVHEFIHILDGLRGSSLITGGSQKDALEMDANDVHRYVNDPAEFNAFFHELIDDWATIHRDLKNLSPEERRRVAKHIGWTGNFQDDFIAAAQHNVMEMRHFLLALNTPRFKRLMSRAYKLHKVVNDLINQTAA